MEYLVDSDWVADYLNGREQAVTLLQSLSADGLAISILTFGEIYEGILHGSNRPVHESGFRRFLEAVDVLPLTRSAMRRFADLRGALRRQGELIGDIDLLIAATALDYRLILLTRNLRHFHRIPGLRIYGQ